MVTFSVRPPLVASESRENAGTFGLSVLLTTSSATVRQSVTIPSVSQVVDQLRTCRSVPTIFHWTHRLAGLRVVAFVCV